MNLEQLGWNNHLEEEFAPFNGSGYSVGRVALEHKHMYRILTEQGELLGEVSGKFRHESFEKSQFPAVGDWVVISARPDEKKATIHKVLPRFSKFSRNSAGLVTEEQLVAANINTVFLVTGLNNDFNIRRIERYLVTAWDSGANPVVILSKCDLCDDIPAKIAEVESVAFGVPIYAISATNGIGMDQLDKYLSEGQTVALLGSSGAGKSTLCNTLLGQIKQQVKEVREGDDKGKHTTTHRELMLIPGGGILIDTPGMRELQLWEVDGGMSHGFSDIEDLAQQCLFNDCQHKNEPSCQVKLAIEEGVLDQKRYDNYVKFQKELAFLERKNNKRTQLEEKAKWKKISGDRTRVHKK
ncbi:ribosome small subunit-dependent GTPase A [Peribacillus alkalitolerans]|uniref:ribosome small subunit-dependent GTPase A n=1 Tax=Peribacillus alkalitolerans TaxID=1550385 RepID=UPI0013D32455|nr:ribosome small subunit-dependent GTPase A [Peribacillus alkalitolerans]